MSRLADPEQTLRDHDAHAWRHTRLPMLREAALLLAQRLGLLPVDRQLGLGLKLQAAHEAGELLVRAPWSSDGAGGGGGSAVARLVLCVGAQMMREAGVVLVFLSLRLPARGLGIALQGLSMYLARVRAWLLAASASVSDTVESWAFWVKMGGPQAWWVRVSETTVRRARVWRTEVVRRYRAMLAWGGAGLAWWRAVRDSGASLYSEACAHWTAVVTEARARAARGKKRVEEWRRHTREFYEELKVGRV